AATPAGAAAGSRAAANPAARRPTRPAASGGAVPVMTPISTPAVAPTHGRTPAPAHALGTAAAGRREQPRRTPALEQPVQTPFGVDNETPTEVAPPAEP